MTRRFSLLVIFFLSGWFPSYGAAAPYANPASLAADLRALAHSVDSQNAATLAQSLPADWLVHTADRDYTISTGPLRKLLTAASVADAQHWLTTRAQQLETYRPAPYASTDPRSALQRILARSEFAPPAPQGIWNTIRNRISRWINSLLERLFGEIGKRRITGTLVFWVALLGGIGLLSNWLIQILRDRPGSLNLTGFPQRGPHGTGEQWLAAMRTAASGGDLRKAIQCSYWAAVSRLQAGGTLPAQSAQTPREYLRFLASAQSGSAALPPLRALTRSLEHFWYGFALATSDDLAACLQSLQELGFK